MGQFTFGLLNVLAEIEEHNIGLRLTSNAKLAKKKLSIRLENKITGGNFFCFPLCGLFNTNIAN